MALALVVKNKDIVFLDDSPMVVTEMRDLYDIDVTFKGKQYRVSDQQATMLGDNVRVWINPPEASTRPKCQLVFEAPKSVTILREAVRNRNAQAHAYPG